MPDAMTFDSLKLLLADYVERGSLSDEAVYDNLGTMINNAERNISVDLNVTGVRTVVSAALEESVAVYSKPELWRRTTSINIGVGASLSRRKFLFSRVYEYIRTFWPDDTQTGEPVFYGDYDDDHFIVAPTPDADYPFEMIYSAKPTLLDDTNQTNWITENWPQLLLYKTLLEIAPFLKGDERIPTWTGMYETLKNAITMEDTKKIVDRSTTRQEA